MGLFDQKKQRENNNDKKHPKARNKEKKGRETQKVLRGEAPVAEAGVRPGTHSGVSSNALHFQSAVYNA